MLSATDARLKLSTTTSTQDAGILDVLLPPFEKKCHCQVNVIAVGTGKALKLGESGDVDVVLVHARSLEDQFVAAGFGVNRRDVMFNDFVLIGPPDDPAHIRAVKTAADALKRIAAVRIYLAIPSVRGTLPEGLAGVRTGSVTYGPFVRDDILCAGSWSSSSILGKALRVTIAVGFFDESTDEDTAGVCYVVAGFVAHNHETAVLDLRWTDLLLKYNLKYFKASELSAGEGEFKQYRDNPLAKDYIPFSPRETAIFKEIKTAFTDIIIQADGLNGVAAALFLPDYERLIKEDSNAKQKLALPYFICSNLVLMESGLQISNQNRSLNEHDRISLRPVFDSHEEYSGRMKLGFDLFRQKNPISSRYLLPPHYEDDQRYPMLQVADNLAFEIRKHAVNTRSGVRERVAMKRLRESGQIFKAYRLDYTGLKTIADAQSPDFNPLTPIDYTIDDILRTAP